MDKQLSILIPVYKVEKYIRPFFESIFRQGLSDDCYEIIVVNDGTPDHSMEKMADLLARHNNVTVINQENQGLSVARNNALERATGEYVLMLDPDDLLIDGTLSVLLEKALESKVDLVVANYLKMYDDEIATFTQPVIQQDVYWREKTGKQLFLKSLSPYTCYVWRTLYRRQFLLEQHIRFIPDIYVQDIPFTHECFIKATNCLKTNLQFIIYRQRNGQATSSFTLQHVKSFGIALNKTWELRKIDGISHEEYKKLQSDIFVSFYILLQNIVTHFHGFSNQLHAMDLFTRYCPDLRFSGGTLHKLISFLYGISPRMLIISLSLWWRLGGKKMVSMNDNSVTS